MELLTGGRRLRAFKAADAFAVEAYRVAVTLRSSGPGGLIDAIRRVALRSGGALVAAAAEPEGGSSQSAVCSPERGANWSRDATTCTWPVVWVCSTSNAIALSRRVRTWHCVSWIPCWPPGRRTIRNDRPEGRSAPFGAAGRPTHRASLRESTACLDEPRACLERATAHHPFAVLTTTARRAFPVLANVDSPRPA